MIIMYLRVHVFNFPGVVLVGMVHLLDLKDACKQLVYEKDRSRDLPFKKNYVVGEMKPEGISIYDTIEHQIPESNMERKFKLIYSYNWISCEAII